MDRMARCNEWLKHGLNRLCRREENQLFSKSRDLAPQSARTEPNEDFRFGVRCLLEIGYWFATSP